jgi:hypothetical protein
MIEYLAPVISLGKLITEGLKSIRNKSIVRSKRVVQRKIIQVQLLLEDVIDNAHRILSIIENKAHTRKLSPAETNELLSLSRSQQSNIILIVKHLSDYTSDDILKLFAPSTRRRIFELIHIKGGVIQELLRDLQLSDEEDVLYADSVMYEWDFDRFIDNGFSYARAIVRHQNSEKISIFERLPEQRDIVAQLAACSQELSDFIRGQMNIEDVVAARPSTKA